MERTDFSAKATQADEDHHICADTKLMIGWHVGNRDASDAYWFMHDLAAAWPIASN